MTIFWIVVIVFGYFGAYMAGRERGYSDALADIFVEAPTCPHGDDWDHCPVCCH